MKLPERTDMFLMPTVTLVAAILMIAHLWGHITGWGWPVLYVTLFFLGHSQEYKNLYLGLHDKFNR